MQLEIIKKAESRENTMKYIDANRNWSVEKQAYKFPEAEKCNAELTECKIYQRGEYIILEHQKIVHYWEMATTNYPYFKMAIDLMQLDRPAKWKTLNRLISLRMGIRQTEVNCCGYVESILLQEGNISLKRFTEFMKLARCQDFTHHGCHTF